MPRPRFLSSPLARCPRLVLLALVPLLLFVAAAPALAQEPGTAKGTATFNGNDLAIAYAAIYAEEKGFYDENDPTWTLVLTAEPVAPREIDDPFHDPSLTIGITWTSEFGDEPALEVLSNTLRVDSGSLSGGTTPTLEITSRDGDAWIGRIHLPEEQEFFDDRYFYDLAFHAPLVDPSAPIGDPLPEGGGAPGESYLRWTQAIHSGDLERIRALVPAEMAAMLDEPDAAESLELMALMTPQDVEIVSGSISGDEAVLRIVGTMEGEPVKGEVTMTRQGDLWLPTSSSME
ncbi:MAG: hypothetical protein DWQ36_02870 [Acidobacteria bacterium]|nr:MAG: hypothetical protein DWQ30_02535 [Acidobacteriota bacterium]REK11069.1 MAG: hypothetical protein DWQ36_02870 [Acidobacteriota bacterium]